MRVVTPTGHPASVWQPIIDDAPSFSIDELTPRRGPLVVLGAHPDDETIGAGRLVAAWVRERGEVTVASMSAGEACLDHLGLRVVDLAHTRRVEFRNAGRELGARQALCWSVPDGDIAGYLPFVRDQLAVLLTGAAAVAAPWRFDPHPDHAALGAAAATSCAQAQIPLLEYPIWSTFWQRPSAPQEYGYQVVRVDTRPEDTDSRARALACYRSQTEPLRVDLTPVIPAAMLEHHQQQVLFRPSPQSPRTTGHDDDHAR